MSRYRKKPAEVEAWQVGSDEPMPVWVNRCRMRPHIFHGENPYYVKEDGQIAILSSYSFEQAYDPVREMLDSGAGEDFACPWCGAYNIPRSFRDSGGHLTEASFCPNCGNGLQATSSPY